MSAAAQIAAYRETFAGAMARSPGDVHTGYFDFGGLLLRTRIVGAELAATITRPLIRAVSTDREPELTVDLWSAADGPPAPLVQHDDRERGSPGTEHFAFTADGRHVRHSDPGFALWLDRAAGSIVGWVRSPEGLSPWHHYRPWHSLLGPWITGVSNRQVVHAAMVARRSSGVLLPGRNNAGKSTAAMACLEAGFDILGDDAVAVGIDGQTVTGSGFYSVIKARHPPERVGDSVQVLDSLGAPEFLLFLNGFARQRVRATSRVIALALPEVTDSTESTWEPSTRRHALTMLLATDLSILDERIQDDFQRLATLTETLRLFRLRIGRDPRGVAAAVDAIIREAED